MRPGRGAASAPGAGSGTGRAAPADSEREMAALMSLLTLAESGSATPGVVRAQNLRELLHGGTAAAGSNPTTQQLHAAAGSTTTPTPHAPPPRSTVRRTQGGRRIALAAARSAAQAAPGASSATPPSAERCAEAQAVLRAAAIQTATALRSFVPMHDRKDEENFQGTGYSTPQRQNADGGGGVGGGGIGSPRGTTNGHGGGGDSPPSNVMSIDMMLTGFGTSSTAIHNHHHDHFATTQADSPQSVDETSNEYNHQQSNRQNLAGNHNHTQHQGDSNLNPNSSGSRVDGYGVQPDIGRNGVAPSVVRSGTLASLNSLNSANSSLLDSSADNSDNDEIVHDARQASELAAINAGLDPSSSSLARFMPQSTRINITTSGRVNLLLQSSQNDTNGTNNMNGTLNTMSESSVLDLCESNGRNLAIPFEDFDEFDFANDAKQLTSRIRHSATKLALIAPTAVVSEISKICSGLTSDMRSLLWVLGSAVPEQAGHIVVSDMRVLARRLCNAVFDMLNSCLLPENKFTQKLAQVYEEDGIISFTRNSTSSTSSNTTPTTTNTPIANSMQPVENPMNGSLPTSVMRAATGMLWEVCDSIIHNKVFPANNVSLCATKVDIHALLVQDAIYELHSIIQNRKRAKKKKAKKGIVESGRDSDLQYQGDNSGRDANNYEYGQDDDEEEEGEDERQPIDPNDWDVEDFDDMEFWPSSDFDGYDDDDDDELSDDNEDDDGEDDDLANKTGVSSTNGESSTAVVNGTNVGQGTNANGVTSKSGRVPIIDPELSLLEGAVNLTEEIYKLLSDAVSVLRRKGKQLRVISERRMKNLSAEYIAGHKEARMKHQTKPVWATGSMLSDSDVCDLVRFPKLARASRECAVVGDRIYTAAMRCSKWVDNLATCAYTQPKVSQLEIIRCAAELSRSGIELANAVRFVIAASSVEDVSAQNGRKVSLERREAQRRISQLDKDDEVKLEKGTAKVEEVLEAKILIYTSAR